MTVKTTLQPAGMIVLLLAALCLLIGCATKDYYYRLKQTRDDID